MLALNNGKDSYLEWSALDSDLFDILSNNDFNTEKNNLFNYLTENKITFRTIFDELDLKEDIVEKYDTQNEELFKKINEYCLVKQSEAEIRDLKANEMMDKLTQMVDLEIVSLREREIDYRDVVEVKIKMTNKTDKPIEAISFNIEIIDKLGNNLATLRCRSNDRFVESDIGVWTYNRWDQGEVYNALKNTKLSHISTKNEIIKINHDGELLSLYSIIDELDTNHDYVAPKKLSGNCPYLDDDDKLSQEKEKAVEALSERLEVETPTLTKIDEFIGDLIFMAFDL